MVCPLSAPYGHEKRLIDPSSNAPNLLYYLGLSMATPSPAKIPNLGVTGWAITRTFVTRRWPRLGG